MITGMIILTIVSILLGILIALIKLGVIDDKGAINTFRDLLEELLQNTFSMIKAMIVWIFRKTWKLVLLLLIVSLMILWSLLIFSNIEIFTIEYFKEEFNIQIKHITLLVFITGAIFGIISNWKNEIRKIFGFPKIKIFPL
jgi:hypothetical protein